MPKLIVEFLKLPLPESYTGHCFRRSTASLLANSGADLLTIKRHCGWKSSCVEESYVEESIANKVGTCRKIFVNAASKEVAAGSSEQVATLLGAALKKLVFPFVV
ncbi:hypothetical protein ANN_06361 [Periplaneta americana]|uniref:Tyr recombinase domain-containing protein n=1 Tax=Periplaneta americana TaxID=6978 RepID=A0ABQ8TDC6_PERAM|nr:hypothetical protein ANN_06361 [Periplaneta americana]